MADTMLTMTLRITDCLEINDLQLQVIGTSEEISRFVTIFFIARTLWSISVEA
jgi:hypothetical protein